MLYEPIYSPSLEKEVEFSEVVSCIALFLWGQKHPIALIQTSPDHLSLED